MDEIVANNRLAAIRIARGLTQAQVEDMTEISQSDLSKYENRTARISIERAKVLADCYKVSLDEIFMRDYNVDYKLVIRENEQNTIELEIANGIEFGELYKLLVANNFVASLVKKG